MKDAIFFNKIKIQRGDNNEILISAKDAKKIFGISRITLDFWRLKKSIYYKNFIINGRNTIYYNLKTIEGWYEERKENKNKKDMGDKSCNKNNKQ